MSLKDTNGPKLPLAIVEWHDADTGEEVVELDTVSIYHAPTKVTTLGWVMRDDAVGITLVNEYYNSRYRGRTFIPRAMIVNFTPCTLTKVKKAKSKSHPAPQTSAPSHPPSE